MWRRPAFLVALALAVTSLTVTIDRPALSATAPIKIMPLGDSITGSPGCWRALLWNRLQSSGYTNIDFVGTQPPQGCGVTYDGDNEGHGGALATNIVSLNELPGWLSATNPDIVLMHLGTNDVWSNIDATTILAAYSTLVDQMRANNPRMRILVAQIIPMNPSGCAECAARVVTLNNAIPAWAAGKTTAASPITVVDQWTGFDDATDTNDGVHPNSSGDQKMSDRWYPALAAQLTASTASPTASASPTVSASRTASPSPSVTASPTSGPSPSVTASPTSSPSPTAGAAVCTAAYHVLNQWQGGFQAEVSVTNSGTRAISGWTVGFTFGAGQQITQSWNATLTQTGSAVTATNLSWNGALAPTASTSLGFLANWTGSNPVPSVTCTAG